MKNISDLISDWGFSLQKKSLIIGSVPPPIGGVSIHVERLSSILSGKSFKHDIFDVSKSSFLGSNFFKLFLKIYSESYDQVHIHSASSQILCAVLLAKAFKRIDIFFSVHNPVSFKTKSGLHIFLMKKTLNKAYQINAVSDSVKSSIVNSESHLEPIILVRSAFLPPDQSKRDNIKKLYPNSLKSFLQRVEPRFILNASGIRFDKGIDVYGLDISIELLLRLSKKYSNVGMILALGKKNSNTDYLNFQLEKLKENQLGAQLYVLYEFPNIWPLFEDCEIMVRPTLYDGSSLSILEALSLGCKVVASDSIPRPKDCFLFKNRNIDDFERVCLEVLKSIRGFDKTFNKPTLN